MWIMIAIETANKKHVHYELLEQQLANKRDMMSLILQRRNFVWIPQIQPYKRCD